MHKNALTGKPFFLIGANCFDDFQEKAGRASDGVSRQMHFYAISGCHGSPAGSSLVSSSMPQVNQQYIADQLQISRATVSRCFTNHPGINPVTRAKVFQLASQLGYPYMEIRAPRKSRSAVQKTLGVLICSNVEEYFRSDYQSPGDEIQAGISEYAQLHNLKIDLRYVDPTDKTLACPSYAQIEPLRNRDWDGVLLIYPFPREVIDGIGLRFPMVSLVEQYGSAQFNCIDVDHYKGIAMIVNEMVSLGHQQIGFYTKAYEVEPGWSFRRFGAYVEKMTRLRQPLVTENIVNVYPNCFETLAESYDHVAKRISDGVTGWVCAADHQAYDLMAALKKRGVKVPRDASVTGFDGIQKPAGALQLTTAVVPFREIGFSGTKRLLDMINRRFGSPQHILIGCQIRAGETLSAPACRDGKATDGKRSETPKKHKCIKVH